MRFSLSWLKEHLDTDADVQTIADTLTRIGLEVEGIEDKAKALSNFIVAEIVSAVQHPDADRLRVCQVNIGPASSGEAVGQNRILQVVCGAPNARAGLKGVFAPPDTYVPGAGITMKVAKIRGVESNGMMCSERELELSAESDGIIELASDAVPGSRATDALGLNDPAIDVNLTPNRGDCTSVYGIARDLAAAGLGTLKDGRVAPVAGQYPSPIKTGLVFTDDTKSACPIFAGRLVRGLKNGPSPEWLQARLKAIGLRPISALVDVTNYISFDRGRPLHVFDAKTLSGNLSARLAKEGETLNALDGKTYTLDPGMTVIADDAAARGIAGVIGGIETGCTEATTDVFIESAWFEPARTAMTGRKLGIISDARYRFERGVDPEFVLGGLELATQMILDLCGGEASEVVVAGAPPEWRRTIAFDPSAVKRLAGLDVPATEIARILIALGFEVGGTATVNVTPPSWRPDIHGTADLVEEVVRIKGLDAIIATPMARPDKLTSAVLTTAQRRSQIARRALAARGLNECISFSFVPGAHAALFGGSDEARLLENPISADLDALRPSVVPSLLAAVQRNQARGVSSLSLFEIGPQFASGKPGDQTLIACGLRSGLPPRHWLKPAAPDVFSAKADMLAALEAAWGQSVSMPATPGAPGWYHPGRSGVLAMGPKILAAFGELHPRIAAAFDIKGPVALFEIYLDRIPEAKSKDGKTRPPLDISAFPAVERDFAFVVGSSVSVESVLKAAKTVDRKLIDDVSVFDVYEGKGVPEGQKSLAISVRLQPRDKTLTDAEIDAVASKIIEAVTKATGGTLRA